MFGCRYRGKLEWHDPRFCFEMRRIRSKIYLLLSPRIRAVYRQLGLQADDVFLPILVRSDRLLSEDAIGFQQRSLVVRFQCFHLERWFIVCFFRIAKMLKLTIS